MNYPIGLKEFCTGCSACFNICPVKCIDMKMDKEGFLFPIIKSNECTDCQKCKKVCPILSPAELNNNNNPSVYACWNKDEGIRYESSSGGAFSALAASVIEEDGVVYGAAYDNTMTVRHIAVTNNKDLYKLRGSKYVQSDLGNVFSDIKEHLNVGKKVLFSGTPCQVAGLKNFMMDKSADLITCDLFCHGVPSPGLFSKYIKYIEKKIGEKVVDYKFRSKQYGWGVPSRVVISEHGTQKVIKNKDDSFYYGFAYRLFLRNACYNCKYTKVERVGDITLGDFWGIEEIAEFKHKTRNGISLIFVNSLKGRKLLDSCSNYLILEKRNIEESKYKRKNEIEKPFPRPSNRDCFLEDYTQLTYDKLAQKYLQDKGLKGLIKKIIPNIWIYKTRNMFKDIKCRIK